jgi:plasmid stabilization system protein ParE
MKVLWSKKASNELEAIYNYIKKGSPQNAILVFNGIYDLANSLPNFPYKFPVEAIINIEKVRFVAIWSFKIIYSVEKDSVVILRIFNTKQNPKKLK